MLSGADTDRFWALPEVAAPELDIDPEIEPDCDCDCDAEPELAFTSMPPAIAEPDSASRIAVARIFFTIFSQG
jgi:hypothetical protein